MSVFEPMTPSDKITLLYRHMNIKIIIHLRLEDQHPSSDCTAHKLKGKKSITHPSIHRDDTVTVLVY